MALGARKIAYDEGIAHSGPNNYLELTKTADSVKDMRESIRVATLAWL